MSTTATQTGRPTELGRYWTAAGEERVLIGRRVDGEVRVYDVAAAQGRTYFVEAGFESKAELAMLIADYRRQAAVLGVSPMSRAAIAELAERGAR